MYNYFRTLYLITLLFLVFLTSCKKHSQTEIITNNSESDTTELSEKGWRRFSTENSSIGDNQINSIAIDKEDVKWVGTANGLVAIKGKAFIRYLPSNSPLPSAYITSVAVTAYGKIWVGTTDGLACFDGNVWRNYSKNNSLLPDDEISCLTYDPVNAKIWVGTSKGLVEINKDGNFKVDTAKDGEHVYGLSTETSGILWAATFDHTSFRGKIGRFDGQNWTGNRLSDLGYYSAHPFAVTVDKHGIPYFAIGGTSVNAIIYSKGNGWDEVPLSKGVGGIRTMASSSKGIWIGGRQLYLWDGSAMHSYQVEGTDSPVATLAVDQKGAVWVGTMYGGLAVFRN